MSFGFRKSFYRLLKKKQQNLLERGCNPVGNWYNILMPYILSHASVAYRLGKRLGCCKTEQDRALYMLGSLGPDIYFFDRLPPTPFHPNQKKHGNALHGVPCDALVRAFFARADESLLPYVYGFLTHIALDSTLHPYICSRYNGPDHTRFEGDIDAIFYARCKDEVPFGELFRLPANVDALDSLVTDVSMDTVHAGVKGAFRRSIKKMLRLFPVLYDPLGKRFRFVAPLEKALHKEGAVTGFLLAYPRSYFPDPMNTQHTPWYAKTFPTVCRTESVDELFAEAEAFGERLLRAAMQGDFETTAALCEKRTLSDGPLP